MREPLRMHTRACGDFNAAPGQIVDAARLPKDTVSQLLEGGFAAPLDPPQPETQSPEQESDAPAAPAKAKPKGRRGKKSEA